MDSMERTMRYSIFVLLSLSVAFGHADGQEPVDLEVIERIIEEGTERSQVMEHFNFLTNIIGPRLSATPAYKRAADWSTEILKGWGLEEVHLESWEYGRGWTLEGLTLEMTSPRYFPIIGFPEAWTPSTEGVLEGKPVYIGDWTTREISERISELRGKIILVAKPQSEFIKKDRLQPADFEESVTIGAPRFLPTEVPADRATLAQLLYQAGVGAVLRPSQGEHGTMFVLGRDNPETAVPTVITASEHYNMLVRLLESENPVELRVKIQSKFHEEDTNGYNVLGEIKGVDPEIGQEVVMVGAHLDSWHSATGATDNADASAATIEAMRILRALDIQPRRTIRVALWGSEEQGLHGSRQYVERHYSPEHLENRENFSVYLNHDPGTGAIYGWYMQENAAAKKIFDAWLKPLINIGARKNVIENIGSTDHLSFSRAGLPGFNTLQDYQDYDVRTHHTNMDFYERVSEEDLRENAIVIASFLYHAAMRDEKIPRVPIS
ncbi:MAG: peptidase M28 [Gemmatimonadetes bacterium]|nr:peptidase M28 [Gemmatimonadota bacterium]